jgi:hypothetical protein
VVLRGRLLKVRRPNSILGSAVIRGEVRSKTTNAIGSTIEGSSFSGLLTRVEIGHIRIGSAGNGRIRSRGSGSSLSQGRPGATYRQAAFAFQLAREVTGRTEGTYRAGAESRAGLMLDPAFAAAFTAAKERIRKMEYLRRRGRSEPTAFPQNLLRRRARNALQRLRYALEARRMAAICRRSSLCNFRNGGASVSPFLMARIDASMTSVSPLRKPTRSRVT